MSKKNKYEDPYALEAVDAIIQNVFQTPSFCIGEFDEKGDLIDDINDRWWDYTPKREDDGTLHAPSYADYLNAKAKKKHKKDKKKNKRDDDYLLSPINGSDINPQKMEEAVMRAHLAAQEQRQRDVNNAEHQFTKVEDLFAEMESQAMPSDDEAPEMVRGMSYFPSGLEQAEFCAEDNDMRYDPDDVSHMISLSFSYEDRFGRMIVNDGLCSFSELSAGINPDVMPFSAESVLWMLGHDESGTFKYESEKAAVARNGLFKFFVSDRHPAGIFTKDELVEAFGNIASIDSSKFIFFSFGMLDGDEDLYFAYHINPRSLEIYNNFINQASSNFISYVAEELSEYKLTPSIIVEIAELAALVSMIRSHRRAADSFLADDSEYLMLFMTAAEDIDNDGEKTTTIPLFNMKDVFADFVQNDEQTKLKPKTDDISEIENILHVEDYRDINMLGINILGIFDEDEDDDEDMDENAMGAVENIASSISKSLSGDVDGTDDRGETGQENIFIPEDDDYRSSIVVNTRSNVTATLQEHMDVFGSTCETDDSESLLDQISQYVDDGDHIDYEQVHANMSAIGQAIDVFEEMSDEDLTEEKLEEMLQGSVTVSAQTATEDVAKEPEIAPAQGIRVDVEPGVKLQAEEHPVVEPVVETAENVGASTMADALAKAGMVIPVVRRRPNN